MLLGQPAAFIILTYIVSMTILVTSVFVIAERLKIGTTELIRRPFLLNISLFLLLIILGYTVSNLLSLANIILGSDNHYLDKSILFLLFFLKTWLICFFFWGVRFIREISSLIED